MVQSGHNTYQVRHRWERSAVLQENWVKPLDSLFACATAHKIVGYCLTRKECVCVCNLKRNKQTEKQKRRIIMLLPKPVWAQFSAKAWIWTWTIGSTKHFSKYTVFLFAIVSVILRVAPAFSSYSALKFSPQFRVVDLTGFTYVRFFFFFHFLHLSLQSRPQCLHNLTPSVSGHAQKSSGIEIAFISFLCCRLVLRFLA